MYRLKGFFSYAPLVNNRRDEVSTFGELSAHCLTFAKDKTFHTNSAAPQTTLVSFHSVRDGAVVDVPAEAAVRLLNVGQYIYNRAIAGQTSSEGTTLRQALLSEFTGLIQDVQLGTMVHDGQRWMPEWISYRDAQLGEDNRLTVWLSDNAFRRQYDEYHIEVIPPVSDVDIFFRDPLVVKQALDAYDPVAMFTQIQTTRGQYPYTLLQAIRYDYRDPGGSNLTYPTYWIVVIYGEAGNNPDIIRDKIREKVIEESTRPDEEWRDILPEIFTTTEYIITPFWHRNSVPNRELQAGLYSPIIRPADFALLGLTAQGLGYDAAWVDSQFELGAIQYKSLAFGVVGNPLNLDGITHLSAKFPDYFLVTNQSGDFNRMTPYTQEFVTLLDRLVVAAETLTPESDVPDGLAKLQRNGVLYAAAIYDRVTYLVVSKYTVVSLAGQ